jgi:4-hydroxy-tetrahydrodipicolinate reductase
VIRLAQLYTGNVGSEIVRRCAGHPHLELVAVMVHSGDKAGTDSGTLVDAEPNGVVTTQSLDDVLAARPDAAIHSGMLWDVELITTLLRAGVNVYTGIGGFYLPGSPEFDIIDEAGRAGNASFTAGGNIPGLISDVFPLFLTGYTGRIRQIRARQANDVSTYPSGPQIQSLGIGKEPEADREMAEMIDVGFVAGIRQSANMVADGLGVKCTDCVLATKRVVLAEEDIVLPTSGLLVAAGTVAGIEWTWAATAEDREFLRVTNQQTAALGLGPGWRDSSDDPSWTVEIDGEPSIVATFGWPPGFQTGGSTFLLNVSRAMNTIPRLVSASPGYVSVLDFPAVAAGDGLVPVR